MKLRRRIFILGALGLLFVIIAPLTIIFALGYRFDFANWRLVETGTLMVRSEPKGADIFLNNEKIEQKTPAVIRFLLPGEYDFRIQKENYKPWEKHFTVLPEQITVAAPNDDPVYLFLSSPETKTLSARAFDFFYNGNEIIAATASSTITFENLLTKSVINTSIPYPNSAISEIQISPDNNWTFIRQKPNNITAISLSSQKTDLNLNALVPGVVEVQSWGKTDLLILNSAKDLFELNTETGKITKRKSGVNAFTASDNQLYFIGSTSLYMSNKASTTLELLASKLPAFSAGTIIPTSAGQIFALLDGNLFSATANTAVLKQDVEFASWEERSKSLLFGDRHSLWIYDPQTGDKPELIIRSESPVTFAQINFQTGNIFFQQDQKIKAIEIAAQVSRNVTDLFATDQTIEKFYADPAGQYLYFLTKNSGLSEAKIR